MKKNIIDLKLPGFSTYQTAMAGYELKAPDAGQPNFTTLTEYSDYVKTLPEDQKKNLRPQNGITYMPASIVGEDNVFDPSKGLQHVRIVKNIAKQIPNTIHTIKFLMNIKVLINESFLISLFISSIVFIFIYLCFY